MPNISQEVQGEVIEENPISPEDKKKLALEFELRAAQPVLAQLLFGNPDMNTNLFAWTNTYQGKSPAGIFRETWGKWRDEHPGTITADTLSSYLEDTNLMKFKDLRPDDTPLN